LRGQRGELYEGGLRVPMIARWPDHFASGRTLTTPWAAWDFAPTALDIALAPPAKDLGGQSAYSLLAGQAQPDRDELFIWSVRGAHPAHAARLGNWKVVQPEGKPPEFYDLKADLAETNSITDPELAKQFAALPW
jgi:arylsulfatase A-like enzyme